MGRGVFTSEDLEADLTIEISPVIIMNAEERKLIDQTALHDYIFEWGVQQENCCMALGFIPLYNHSYISNCEYFMDFEEEIIFIKTIRVIEKGEQLTINYNGDFNNNKKVWFQTK